MRHQIYLAVSITLVFSFTANAVNLVEDFNSGIPSARWDVFTTGTTAAPWSVVAPDGSGAVKISKSADSDASTAMQHLVAGIRSKFALDGDFSAFVDFNLPTFPFSDGQGWNEAVIRVGRMNSVDPFGDDAFETLRMSELSNQNAQGFSNIPPNTIGKVTDFTVAGKLGITRAGSTLSAWIDRGSGPVFLGSLTSSLLVGPVNVQILASQVVEQPFGRPHTALDVRFDNFTVTADSIVPEPATLSLLAIGGIMIMQRRRYAHEPGYRKVNRLAVCRFKTYSDSTANSHRCLRHSCVRRGQLMSIRSS